MDLGIGASGASSRDEGFYYEMARLGGKEMNLVGTRLQVLSEYPSVGWHQ